MNTVIHQGANTLGGNCVEVRSGNQAILIDVGIPVNADPILSRSDFNAIANRVEAIFISHPHPDHYEMLAWLEKSVPVYMSKGCKKIINVAHTFGQTAYNPDSAFTFSDEHVEISNDNSTGITIKPIEVDHSGFDSQAFLISDDKQHILYSGDIRDHGRQNYLIHQLVKTLPKNIDTLILEGTLLSREYNGIQTEKGVEDELTKMLQNSTELGLIAFSSQNIDRLVSVYKACLRTQRTLIIDPYTAYLLVELRELSGNLPQYSWNNIGVLFAANSYTQTIDKKQLYRFARAKVTTKVILNNPGEFVIKSNRYMEQFIDRNAILKQTTLVYSQWSGYATGIWESSSVQHIHCSGHAKIETLEELVRNTNPDQLIPIHTEDRDTFKTILDKLH